MNETCKFVKKRKEICIKENRRGEGKVESKRRRTIRRYVCEQNR